MTRRALSVAVAAVVLLLAGCASPLDDLDADVPRADVVASIGPDPALVAQLPPAQRASGVLRIGANLNGTPPAAFHMATGAGAGIDVDISDAVARVLGLRVARTESTFDAILPGLSGGRFDIGTGNLSVTTERKRVVDFVTYVNDGDAFTVRADDPRPMLSDLSQLCGQTVSVLAGSSLRLALDQASGRCDTLGRPPLNVVGYLDGPTSGLALVQRRADVAMDSLNGVQYHVKHQPRIRFAGTHRRAPVGFALAKGTPLSGVICAAMQRLIADGSYARILEKWGIASSGIRTSEINPLVMS